MKRLDLLLGIKSEQSLRDAVREAGERNENATDELELVPVGQKDWVAGKRFASSVKFRDLNELSESVLAGLIALGSQQRIRRENIKIFSVKPHVPVFKDVLEDLEETAPRMRDDISSNHDESTTCPSCGLIVHSYNLLHNASGETVGCYVCRGEKHRH